MRRTLKVRLTDLLVSSGGHIADTAATWSADRRFLLPVPVLVPSIFGVALLDYSGCVARESLVGNNSAQHTTQRQEHEETGVANIKSQMKRIRTNEEARKRNQSVKSALRTAIRSFREAADSGDKEAAAARLQFASRKLDKAASKGVIHANQAANKKSALALALNKI